MPDTPPGIIICGPNGSGKTTLGREVARVLGFLRMDHEDYCFEQSDPPYTKPRPRGEYLRMMLADIKCSPGFVLSACKGDFGEAITRHYALCVYISAPRELRLGRVEQRGYGKHGDRVREGGDMYEKQKEFLDFAANRPLEPIERWPDTLDCPVIRLDGAVDLRANTERAAAEFRGLI